MTDYQAIIDELQTMVDKDQAMRKRYFDHPDKLDVNIDHQNTNRLKAIVGLISWPSVSKVGVKASKNAWLLVQHADGDPEFQKKCLKLMKQKPSRQVSKVDIAYLEDRIAVNHGKPQIYGTQFYTNSSGKLVPRPITDIENVDRRRQDVGLEPLLEYQKELEEMCINHKVK